MYEDHETTNYELPRETHLRRTLTRQSMNRLRDKQTKLAGDRRQAEELDNIRRVEREGLMDSKNNSNNVPVITANINNAMDLGPGDEIPPNYSYYDRPAPTEYRGEANPNGLRMGDLIQSGIVRRSTRRKIKNRTTNIEDLE